jgi:hypothetical protein
MALPSWLPGMAVNKSLTPVFKENLAQHQRRDKI